MIVMANVNQESIERQTLRGNCAMPNAHFHNKHELYFLLRGKTKYFIGNEIYLLSAGDIIFVPKGEFHRTDNTDSSLTERTLLNFDDEFVGKEYEQYILELNRARHVRVPEEHLFKLHDILEKFEAETARGEEGFLEMQKLYLRQLLILICRYKQTERPLKNFSETYQLISDAARYISTHCDDELTLDNLAKQYALSPYYFSKLFKEVTGIGLSQYVNIARITHALQLLSTTKLTVTEIAAKCGFNDSGYFIQTFKKLVGVTPKRYAMKLKK